MAANKFKRMLNKELSVFRWQYKDYICVSNNYKRLLMLNITSPHAKFTDYEKYLNSNIIETFSPIDFVSQQVQQVWDPYYIYILNIYNIIFSTIDSVSQRVQQVREPDCRSYNVHLLWSVWQYFHFRNNILWFIEWYDVHLLWSVWQYFLFKTFFVPQTSSTMSTTTCSPVVRRRTMLITPGRKVLHLGSTSTT